MKILFFYQYFGTPAGSWSTRVYELTRRWVAAGHKVTVVTAPYEKSDIRGKGFISHQNIEGIHLVVINSADSNRNGLLKRVWHALLFSLVAIKYALTLPCDVVIASSGPITIGLPALAAKWLRGKKMVFEVRDLWPQGAVELGKMKNPVLLKIGFWFEKVCYKNAALVVPCSKGMEDSIINRFPKTKTQIITNASDTHLFSPHGFTPRVWGNNEEKYFIYTGSLGLMDDASQFIDAFLSIKREDIKLYVLGDGAERKLLEEKVSKSSNSNIQFLGLLSKTEVIEKLRNAYAAIVTFRNTPVVQTSSPNKMFDAFAAGVPIIQNTNGWIKKLVEENQCGINVPQNDASTFAEKIIYLIENPALRNEMALKAFNLGATKFNRDFLAKNYLEELKIICKS